MATNRTPLPSAAMSTPVSRGRASSLEAARTTWRSAPARLLAGRNVAGWGGSGSVGKSSTGKVRRLNRDRAAPISTFSPSDSMVTAPGSSDRTMSARSLAGRHADPVGDPDGLGRGVHGQIEIGARPPPGGFPADSIRTPLEGHGRGTRTDGTAGSGEHLHQGVTLASKLHQEVLSCFCFIDLNWVVMVISPVDWGRRTVSLVGGVWSSPVRPPFPVAGRPGCVPGCRVMDKFIWVHRITPVGAGDFHR